MDKFYTEFGTQLKNNKALILSIGKNYDKALAYADESLINDEGFVLEAVTNNGAALQYASESLKDNETIVLASIRHKWKSLKYASDRLKNKENIVQFAIERNGNAIRYASEGLRNKRHIVLKATKNRCEIDYIPYQFLHEDEEVVKTIFERKYERKYSLYYANETIRSNREIVLLAVKNDGLNLAYASNNLQSDLEIVNAAAIQNFNAFNFTTLPFNELKVLVLNTMHIRRFNIQNYSDNKVTIPDGRFKVLASIRNNIHKWHKAGVMYTNDKELMLLAIEYDVISFYFASEDLKKDREIVIKLMECIHPEHFLVKKYLKHFCSYFKNDLQVLNKISNTIGLSIKKLENYEQYLNATSIMEKWFCELPTSTLNALSQCRTLYYPGAYHDFSTIQFFMENSGVTDFYYADYMNNEINEYSILEALQKWFNKWNGYQITQHINIHPSYFHEDEWDAFWFADPQARFGSEVAKSFISKYVIEKDDKTWNIYYFGTEGIATYEVLLKNNITLDIVVTQDHGLGGCWTSFCKDSLLKKIAKKYEMLPKMILSGGEAWNNYKPISDWFGEFGMHEGKRKLWKQSSK
jgi:hypothetical protein